MYFGDFYLPVYVEREPPKVEVYSLATNSWRNIGTNAGYYALNKSSSAYLNGAVHWVASKTGQPSSDNVVLSFNFDSEKFGEIMVPKFNPHENTKPQVSAAVLKENLILIVRYVNQIDVVEKCCIWVMREYGLDESWTKEYCIVPEETMSRSLCIVNDNDLMMLMWSREVVSYDLEQGQFKHSGIAGNDIITLDLVNFIESFVLNNEGFGLTRQDFSLLKGVFIEGRESGVCRSACRRSGVERARN